ncbi:MAG: hypothetical protein ACYTKC_20420, partial [Planctomycetota bacterium]
NAGGETPRPEPVEEPKVVALGNSTPQVKAVKRWANGIFQSQRYEVENFTAFTPVQELLGIDPEHKYNHSFGDAQRELGKKIIDALLTGEQAGIFQYCEARSGKIMDAAYLTATKGKISLSVMEPKKQREGTVIIDYVEEADGTFKVAGWEVVSAPKRPLSDAELAALRGKRFKVHRSRSRSRNWCPSATSRTRRRSCARRSTSTSPTSWITVTRAAPTAPSWNCWTSASPPCRGCSTRCTR